MRTFKLVLMLALLGASVALATPMQGTALEDGSTADVVVQNHGSSGVHVYVLQAGRMVPLGFVNAQETATLTIHPTFLQSGEAIRLVADPLGSSEWYKSDPVAIRPATQVTFNIADHVDRSSVTVSG